MKKLIFTFFWTVSFSFLTAQAPAIEWQRCIGGSGDDSFTNNLPPTQLDDGGLLFVAVTQATDGDAEGNHGDYDILVVKFNSTGEIEWKRILGGSKKEEAVGYIITNDSKILIIGSSYSNDGDVSNHHGSTSTSDVWLVLLDENGNLEWEKSYGGNSTDIGSNIIESVEGGYIFSASSKSSDGDVSNHHGTSAYYDIWIVKIDEQGNIEWERSYGGSKDEYGHIKQLDDGSYLINGSTWSDDGDVVDWHYGTGSDIWRATDGWIVNIDQAGNIIKQKCFGGSGVDFASAEIQLPDGGFMIFGLTSSDDGDVEGWHPGYLDFDERGTFDIWIIKADSNFNIEWQKCLGGTSEDLIFTFPHMTNDGFLIFGDTQSNDGDISNLKGEVDIWLVKLDLSGNIVWEKCIGGSYYESVYDVVKTENNDYVIVGETYSFDGDVSNNHNDQNNPSLDIWIVKINELGEIIWESCYGGTGLDYFPFITKTSDNGYFIAGSTYSTDGDVSGNHGGKDYWVFKLNPDGTAATVDLNYKSSVSIYPIPMKNNLNVSAESVIKEVSFWNMNGQLMKTEDINSTHKTMNTSFFNSGVYILKVKLENGSTEAFKIIK